MPDRHFKINLNIKTHIYFKINNIPTYEYFIVLVKKKFLIKIYIPIWLYIIIIFSRESINESCKL